MLLALILRTLGSAQKPYSQPLSHTMTMVMDEGDVYTLFLYLL
jgi:hypothetical protein